MDRKLVVTLLKNNIQELDMITEGFMEMKEYPKPIIALARKKTEDILNYISQLDEIKSEVIAELVGENAIPAEIVETFMEKENVNIAIETATAETITESIKEVKGEEEKEIIKQEEYKIEPETEETGEEFFENEKIEELTENMIPEIVEETEKKKEELNTEQTEKDTELIIAVKEEKITFHNIEVEKNTIADSHNNKKIDDIRQAISIGDRFRFQRELFNGNGEVLNKTLSYLNQLSDFYEAHTYLQNKFKWDEEDETVESFYQIIRRRYL